MEIPENITVNSPVPAEARDLVLRAVTAVELAAEFVIDGPTMYEAAAGELRDIKARAKKVDDLRKSITKPLDDAKKATMDLFRPAVEAYAQAESILKRSMLDYDKKVAAERREQERLAREAAEAEQNRLLAEAAEAEKSGDTGKAEELMMHAESVPTAPVVANNAPKASGISKTVNWKFEITDANKVPREYLLIDEKKIGQVVRAMKGETNIPGVSAYPEETLRAVAG